MKFAFIIPFKAFRPPFSRIPIKVHETRNCQPELPAAYTRLFPAEGENGSDKSPGTGGNACQIYNPGNMALRLSDSLSPVKQGNAIPKSGGETRPIWDTLTAEESIISCTNHVSSPRASPPIRLGKG